MIRSEQTNHHGMLGNECKVWCDDHHHNHCTVMSFVTSVVCCNFICRSCIAFFYIIVRPFINFRREMELPATGRNLGDRHGRHTGLCPVSSQEAWLRGTIITLYLCTLLYLSHCRICHPPHLQTHPRIDCPPIYVSIYPSILFLSVLIP